MTHRSPGNAFSKLLWSQYEDYQAALQRSVLPVLKEKEAHDAQFVTLCKMSKGAVKYTLHDFLHQPAPGRLLHKPLAQHRGLLFGDAGGSCCRRGGRTRRSVKDGGLPPAVHFGAEARRRRRVDDQSRMRVRPSPVA
ncbi:hypothetical protein HPB47_019176 [Ixodes persulcatus]|uniref:Uncharacterized protein n=1 Tax=Ixodes persulcatus TaxID=34615 RepID=A0AC60QJ44_IXOPE|nr:hypothetical protein HPB47_019176 [Ixodes persulcatus]